jgi:hypothetical protein
MTLAEVLLIVAWTAGSVVVLFVGVLVMTVRDRRRHRYHL